MTTIGGFLLDDHRRLDRLIGEFQQLVAQEVVSAGDTFSRFVRGLDGILSGKNNWCSSIRAAVGYDKCGANCSHAHGASLFQGPYRSHSGSAQG